MTDFYSVLKASIIRRGLHSPADRQEAYEQARTAMSQKLWSFEPPLSEDEIDARIGLFDSAVDKIERDLENDFAEDDREETRQGRRYETPRAPAEPRASHNQEDYYEDADYPPAPDRHPTTRRQGRRSASPTYQSADYDREPKPREREYDSHRETPDYIDDRDPDYDEAAPIEAPRSERGDHYRETEPYDDGFVESPPDSYDDRPDYPQTAYSEPPYADEHPPREPAYRPPAYQEPAEWQQAPSTRRGPAPRKMPSRWEDQPPVDDEDEQSDDRYAAFENAGENAGKKRRVRKSGQRSKRSGRNLVRMLSTAAAGLFVVLIGFNAFLFVPIILDSDAPPPTASATAKKSSDRLPIAGAPTSSSATRIVSDSATASEIPERVLNVAESLVVFAGRDPTIFEGSPNNPIQFDSDAEGGFARISSTASTAGAKALIGPGLAERFAGRTIRVTLLARASNRNGAETIRFAYQSGLALSHWQSVDLSSSYGSYGMIWRVPAAHESTAGDFLLIEPGVPGDGTSTDIRSIKIDILAS